MGAGLSGLITALILEKHGITPVIFEKRSQVGDRFFNGEVLFSLLSMPYKDIIAYLANHYQIYLRPINNIRYLILHSEKQKAVINGHLGFINYRGRSPYSFENQLAGALKSKIIFNSDFTYEQLLKEFTHIVLSTGDAAYASKIQDYQQDLTATLHGVRVTGKFNRYTVMTWLNNRFAPKGYGYLIPLSEQKADLVTWIPDYPENRRYEQQSLWDDFYAQACKDLDQDLTITSHFEVNRYIIGNCHYPRIGNTFFTGNCFGAITPFLGFGQSIAILTGIYAAQDLSGQGNYEELCRPLKQNYQNSLVLRRAWERFDNKRFDMLVRFFGTKLGNRIFNPKKLDMVKIASYLARPWIIHKRMV